MNRTWVWRHHEGLLEEDPTLHDQDALNHLLEHDRAWHDVCTPLPMLFCAPGWLYQAIVPLNMLPLVPFFFHANWLFEAEKKAARMRAVTAVYGRKKRSITNRIYGLIRYTTHQFARLFIER